MFNIATELKVIKQNLKVWNKECFKNIFEEKRKMKEALNQLLEKVISNDMDNH